MAAAPFPAGAAALPSALPVRAASSAGAPAIPFKQDASASASMFSGGAVGVLLISLIAIVAVLFIRKRLNLAPAAGPGTRLLRILETQRMGPRTLLAVVEFGGAHYLVAQGEHGVNCLAQAPLPAAAAGAAVSAAPPSEQP